MKTEMKNKEYWRNCLEEVLPLKTELTDEIVENIMSISVMEYEYCSSEAHISSNIPIESKESKQVKQLEKDIELLKKTICKIKKCDSVIIENGVVKIYSK